MKKFLIVILLVLTACSNTSEIAPPIVVITATVGGNPVAGAAATAAPPSAQLPYPPPTQAKIAASFQNFERGFMIYLSERKQVWVFTRPIIVLSASKDALNYGQWLTYADTFKEGEAETDPTFAPQGSFVQPKRALGKVWRENVNVRTALGWGLEGEQNFTTTMTSYPIAVVEGGKYTPKFAFHLLTLPDNTTIHLNESTRTWSKP